MHADHGLRIFCLRSGENIDTAFTVSQRLQRGRNRQGIAGEMALPPLNAAQLAALPCDEPDCWPDCCELCCGCCHCEVSLLTLLWLRLMPLSASEVRNCGIAARSEER